MNESMLAVTWGQGVITFLFVVVCVLLILIVLLQKGRGGGLSGAFGGGGGGHSAFGAKTGDVFTWITVGLTFFFILIAVVGNWVFVPPGPTKPTAAAVTPAAPASGGATPTPTPAEAPAPASRPG